MKKVATKCTKHVSSLKTDPNSVLFSEEKIDTRLLKKFKKSKYTKDSLLLKLIYLVDKKLNDKEKIPTRVNYDEKREIDRSPLYSFDGPFQLIHADVGSLEFLGKSATTPRYVLLAVDLYSSKIYVYPMRSRKQILQKMKLFYDEIKNKRIKKTMRLQVDNEFHQVKIKDLNDKNNVEMLTTSVRAGKAFAAEQKIRELKSRIAKLNAHKLKISPTKIISSSTSNINSVQSEKYGLSPDEIEKKSLSSERFRMLFNFHRIEKTKMVNDRLDRYDKKKYNKKRRRLRENLNVGSSWENSKKKKN